MPLPERVIKSLTQVKKQTNKKHDLEDDEKIL